MALKLHQRCDLEAEPYLTKEMTPEVRKKLVEIYWPFAQSQAAKRRKGIVGRGDIERDDMEQEAGLALIRAINSWSPAKANGAKISTYLGLRLYNAAIEAERQNDIVPHKVRARDKELRARAVAGDETVRQCDFVPQMNRFLDESDGKRSRAENTVPDSRSEVSEIEQAARALEKMLDALDPVTSQYTRDWLESLHELQSTRRDRVADVTIALAQKWRTTPVGAATIVKACKESLQGLQIAL